MTRTPADGSIELRRISANQYEELAAVPEGTRQWYARTASQGRFGGHFVGIPHVLIRGSIDTDGLERLRGDDAML